MWITNESIRLHTDNWPVLEVDCFTKPHALIIDSMVPGLYDTYLYYVGLIKSYGFTHEFKEGEDWSFEVYPHAAGKLGFSCYFHNCDTPEEFRRLISEKLDRGIPVLIPGNLRFLYYTWAFKKTDAMHLFLVKGYEKDLDLFSIQDNMHIMSRAIPNVADESGVFNNFIMSGKDLVDVWQGLDNISSTYYLGKVITIEKSGVKNIEIPTPEQKLHWFIDQQGLNNSILRYRELSILQFAIRYFKETGEPVDGRERNFRFNIIFACKKAVLEMVLELFRQMAGNESAVEALVLVKQIVAGWERLKQIFYLNLMRNTLTDISDLKKIYDPVVENEKLLIQTIIQKMDNK